MNKRQTQILELLTENDKMEVTKLSEILQVSQVTIRKDLALLEESDLIVREHGYATLNESDDLNHRLAYHYENKQSIAKCAAESVRNGETIMIESGSCCALLALEIAKTKKDVTIITNSSFIADYIRKIDSVKIILLGGEYQKESQVMVGPITRKCVEAFHVDKLFIGTDGFSRETGFTGNDYMRSEAVRDMAKQAAHVFIISDSQKFFQKGVVSLIDTAHVYGIYTDAQLLPETESYLKEQGIHVIKTK